MVNRIEQRQCKWATWHSRLERALNTSPNIPLLKLGLILLTSKQDLTYVDRTLQCTGKEASCKFHVDMNHTELIAAQLRKMAGNFPPWHCCQLKQASARAVSWFLTFPSTEGPTLHILLSAAGCWWRCFCRGKQRSFTSAKTRKGFPQHMAKCTSSVEKKYIPTSRNGKHKQTPWVCYL